MYCPVHTYEYWEAPTEEDLFAELLFHLLGHPRDRQAQFQASLCGHCYEEYQIRQGGIEDVNLYDEHCNRQIEAECTCHQNPKIRRHRIQAEGRNLI